MLQISDGRAKKTKKNMNASKQDQEGGRSERWRWRDDEKDLWLLCSFEFRLFIVVSCILLLLRVPKKIFHSNACEINIMWWLSVIMSSSRCVCLVHSRKNVNSFYEPHRFTWDMYVNFIKLVVNWMDNFREHRIAVSNFKLP